MSRKIRCLLGVSLLAFGALLLAMAPETSSGLMLIGIAVAIEITGIYLEYKK
ncbi:MAG: hypothetical protein V3R65_02540 [Acidiferrobacterales bacterium]